MLISLHFKVVKLIKITYYVSITYLKIRLNMNIWHLKYFFEAAKAGNIKAASEKFSISNSAVSQAIKSLENELGLELLIHKKRFFELTDVGQKFLDKIPTLIHQIESFKEDLQNIDSAPQGTVFIGIPRSLLSIEFVDSLLALKKLYPLLKFKIKSGVTAEIKKNLKNEDIHFGIIIDDEEDADRFSSAEISRGQFLLVAKNDKLKLQNSNLIVTDAKKIEVIALLNETKKRNLKSEIEFEINSWSVIKEMVKKSNFIGYVPDYVVKSDLNKKKLVIIADPIKTFRYSIKVIWPLNRQMPKSAQLLINEVRKNHF